MGDERAQAPPGWYPDPEHAGQGRWWDGQRWAAPPEPAPPRRRRSRRAKVLLALGALAVVGVIAAAAFAGQGKGGASPDWSAAYVCQQAARAELRAPATARFPDPGTAGVSHTGSTYTVATYVDADNGFGALIRSSVHCTVAHSGSTWTALTAAVSG